jgi:hypothetical protein
VKARGTPDERAQVRFVKPTFAISAGPNGLVVVVAAAPRAHA